MHMQEGMWTSKTQIDSDRIDWLTANTKSDNL